VNDVAVSALVRLRDALTATVRAQVQAVGDDAAQVAVRALSRLASRSAASTALVAAARQAPALAPLADAHLAATLTETLALELRHADDFGVAPEVFASTVGTPELRAFARAAQAQQALLGIAAAGTPDDFELGAEWPGPDADVAAEVRASTRRFAREVVEPRAQDIHLHDLLIPEAIIAGMAELGFFGMSIPAEYGGAGMGNRAMVIATEELSRASLPAAGSLITRPEVLAKALLAGGTDAQKHRWLPPVASGELMVGVSVTEPDTGSDVAGVRCRAVPATQGGQDGWAITGAKAWSTFAGRADVLALLARTEADPALGHRGLSLFVVPKDRFAGHDFEQRQPGGGVLRGKADRTLGYRGMHSFTLQLQDWFVPADCLIGAAGGRGKGFYFQMAGFAAGRLQTAGRAVGLAQASVMAASRYARERRQFGRPIGEFPATAWELGRMAVAVAGARALAYQAAAAMDAEAADAALLASMAKHHACRVAVEVSQQAQLLHGGWGYAEEFPIARYVADALVLPIFEGTEPVLELKVIGRALLAEPAGGSNRGQP
jgi:(2S)-methylsuccinyl-CoA dehydrogenase